jgi:hypothetical protein
LRAGAATLIDKGFLEALRAPQVVEHAARYGDPVELLEAWVDGPLFPQPEGPSPSTL